MMSDEPVRGLTAETFRVLSSAIPQDIPVELRTYLQENTFIFSGFKTYHELKEASALLQDEKGGFKSFEAFKRDITGIDNTYNRNYLNAEYKFAVQSSQMAVKWHEFEKDGDRYLLQYRTASDDKVRPEHAVLNGTTLPIDDPFWKSYLPPLDWGCRCTTVQVSRNKYPVSDSQEACAAGERATALPKQKIFRFNPGKDKIVFPPKHPYFKLAKEEKKAVIEAIDGYVPKEFSAKTIEEAETEFRTKLGVNCSLLGLTKTNIGQVEEIFHVVDKHQQLFPQLTKNTQFVGTIRGRIDMLAEKMVEEWERTNGTKAPQFVIDKYKRYARRWAGSSGAYAYSHVAFTQYGLAGVAFNSNWKGEKIINSLESDVKSGYHPIGCATLKATMDHEFGHQLDHLLGLHDDYDFRVFYDPIRAQGSSHIKEILSLYGAKNSKEFIAEAWSEYLNNDQPRPTAKMIGELIKQKYKGKYGN